MGNREEHLMLVQCIVVFLLILVAPVVGYGASLQEEFEALCVHTQEAEDLPPQTLRDLLAQCDQLQKKIEQSNDAKKKVLLFRLKKCRSFFSYIIEVKQPGNSSGSQ